MTCSQCNTRETDRGTICSSCRSRNSRAKKTTDVVIETPTKAIVEEDHVGKVWRSVSGMSKGGEWVVPGVCKWGICLNKNCRFRDGV